MYLFFRETNFFQSWTFLENILQVLRGIIEDGKYDRINLVDNIYYIGNRIDYKDCKKIFFPNLTFMSTFL